MGVEIITKEDLQAFRLQIVNDIKDLISREHANGELQEWLRSNDVRRLLKISPGTLQSFRMSGTLKSKKVGGIHFYRYSDIEKLLSKSNS